MALPAVTTRSSDRKKKEKIPHYRCNRCVRQQQIFSSAPDSLKNQGENVTAVAFTVSSCFIKKHLNRFSLNSVRSCAGAQLILFQRRPA